MNMSDLNCLDGLLSDPATDTLERLRKIIKESEVEELDQCILSKKQVAQEFLEHIEGYKAELEAEEEMDTTFFASVPDDTDATKKKSNILRTYIGVVTTEEFIINKLKIDDDEYNADFWQKLKPVIEKSRNLKKDINTYLKLRETNAEMKQKVTPLMASPH